jgi:chaperone modulatory protein CbpM
MATESQTLWLHAGETVTIEELSTATGLTLTEIHELIEYGALTPVGEVTFSATCVACVRQAARLQRDLELEMPALALVLSFLERIETLELEVRKLTSQAR